MDKTIMYAGIALVCLGVGFLFAPMFDSSLHAAFITGGYLWIVVGTITAGFGYRIGRKKEQQLGALR